MLGTLQIKAHFTTQALPLSVKFILSARLARPDCVQGRRDNRQDSQSAGACPRAASRGTACRARVSSAVRAGARPELPVAAGRDAPSARLCVRRRVPTCPRAGFRARSPGGAVRPRPEAGEGGLGGGGSGPCRRAQGRIPGGEVAAPAPRPAPRPAGERGVAARLPPQPSAPRQPLSAVGRARESGRGAWRRCGSAGRAKGQRPPGSLRRAAAAGAPQLRAGRASRSARTTRRRSGARRGSASLSPSPRPRPLAPAAALRGRRRGRLAPLCPGSPRPRRSPRGTGRRGPRRCCGENPRTPEVAGVVVTPRLLGAGGSDAAWEQSCSYSVAPSSRYPWAARSPGPPRPHHTRPFLRPAAGVRLRGRGPPPGGERGENNGASRERGSGAACPGGGGAGRGTRGGVPRVRPRCAPLFRRGRGAAPGPVSCRGRGWFTVLGRKGRERRRNENQIRTRSPGGRSLAPRRGWEGVGDGALRSGGPAHACRPRAPVPERLCRALFRPRSSCCRNKLCTSLSSRRSQCRFAETESWLLWKTFSL